MGFREQIAEAARQNALQGVDNWYTKEFPYILEIRAAGTASSALGASAAFFTLPLGPEEYSVKRVFRQSVTPTLGGLVPEEGGILWREIRITGTFGLEPKVTQDTTNRPDASLPSNVVKLSGPGWTRRMIRNVFEKYAELKASSEFGPLTTLIWHDMRTDEHYVVVPEEVDIPRTTQKRLQHPYVIVLKAIAKASNVKVPDVEASLSGVGRLKEAAAEINRGVKLVSAAIQEGSAILGEIRGVAADIDSVLTNLNTVISSADDFLEGVVETVSVGQLFINSTATGLETVLETLETATAIPDAVRQNYFLALDGLHAVGAQVSAFDRTYDQVLSGVADVEAGAARETTTSLAAAAASPPPESAAELASQRIRTSDQALVEAGAFANPRLRGTYSGFRDYAVQSGDTLASVAGKFLGDGALWYDLAIVNRLKPPYITAAGAPQTLGIGEIMAIPIAAEEQFSAVAVGEALAVGGSALGVDIELFEDSNTIPGRPVLDIQIDRRTMKDVKLVAGLDNLKQALQLRMWTERGTLPLVPDYGLPRQIGVKATDAFLTLLRLAAEQTIIQDSRVREVVDVRFEVEGDVVEIGIAIVPIGYQSAQTVTLSVV